MKNEYRHEQHKKVIFRRIEIILCFLLLGILVFLVILDQNNAQKEKDRLLQLQEEYKESNEEEDKTYSFSIGNSAAADIEGNGFSAIDVVNEKCEADIVISSNDFYDSAKVTAARNGNDATATITKSGDYSNEDLFILQFTAYTANESGYLSIKCNDTENNVWISSTVATYCIPLTGISDKITITFYMSNDDFIFGTVLDEVYLVNYGNETIENVCTGIYSCPEASLNNINAEEFEIQGNFSSCLVLDNYIYLLETGSLKVYDTSDDTLSLVGECTGMGNTRDMEFNNDNSAIVVTARQNGMYLIDITDPSNPIIASHYATLELSTGIYVSGDYAFVCSRFFGVEFVDISDIYNPKFVNRVGDSSEYQDCYVNNGYLYIGVYKEKRVDIYNIKDLSKPVLCSQINLDGCGQGVYVVDNILYAATGLNSSNASSSLTDFGCGTGNGLEIYDVSDPTIPIHLSTIKTEGRFSYNGRDTWSVTVSNKYAYLSSMYNGIYVFDVSDIYSPTCVDIFRIVADEESELYETLDSASALFPFNTNTTTWGCVSKVILQNGFYYALVTNMGLYRIEYDCSKETRESNQLFEKSGLSYETPVVDDFEASLYTFDTSVYAIDVKDDFYYLAAGDEGIIILDNNMDVVSIYNTSYAVLDIKVRGNYIYTAESEGGIGVYKIEDSSITKVSSYSPDAAYYNKCVSSIGVTSDGNYIVAQSANFSSYWLVDASNKEVLVNAGSPNTGIGGTYFRNICSGIVGNDYICIYGSKLQCWYYYDGDSLQYLGDISNSGYSEGGGMTSVGEYALSIKSGGYFYYDPETNTTSDKVTVDDVDLNGKCFSNGTYLVVVDEYSGEITILNIEDIDNPLYIASFVIDGNPDLGIIVGSQIIIPCRNYGLLVLSN